MQTISVPSWTSFMSQGTCTVPYLVLVTPIPVAITLVEHHILWAFIFGHLGKKQI